MRRELGWEVAIAKGNVLCNQMRRMTIVQRILFCLILGLSGLGKIIAATPDDLLGSCHFIGTVALTNSSEKLKQIAALPESRKFSEDVLQKLARASVKVLGTGNTNQAALVRPLLNDLMAAESWVELRGKTNAEIFIAVQLSQTRSQVWETNLLQLARVSKPVKFQDFTGWQAKMNRNGKFLKFFRAGKWTLVVLGGEESLPHADFLKHFQSENRGSEKNWLEADIDWPRLNSLISLGFVPFKLARTEIKVAGQGENLRSTVRVIYPEKIDWKSEPWQIPAYSIRDPLISFSAGQKLAPFFKPSKTLQQLSFNPLTNQFFFWAQSEMPFQSYVALPVKNATNTLKTLGPQLAAAFNGDLARREGGALTMASNQTDLFWRDLPIIVPFLNPTKEKSGKELLIGGLFPLIRKTNLPPAELFQQITASKDLIFYDWEITQPRLSQWLILSQMLPVFTKEVIATTNGAAKKLASPKMPEQKWLAAIAPLLGNAVTEVTFKFPNELSIVRKSHLGLNSLELVLLSHWLAHRDFPHVNPFATP